MQQFDRVISDLVASVTGQPAETIASLIELPRKLEMGDRAIPCFRWAKDAKTTPKKLAEKYKKEIEKKLPSEIEKVDAAGGYLNFFIRRSVLAAEVLGEIARSPGKYGFVKRDQPQVAVIEFSSPNIAKPFSIGHLRSTNIGAALSRILKARGWRVIRLNHLGDWGTQFGRLIAAYRRWGNAVLLKEEPITNLYKLYVRFHEEEVSDPTLIEEARDWFVKLEQGDEEAKELWQWFRELSLMELQRLYCRLGVEFDHFWGESFYAGKMQPVLDELEAKKISTISDDATIVDLEAHGMPTCVVKKSNDSSLYLTRDLASAIFRYKQFEFKQMIYVVGAPQQLHFKQTFKILDLLGHAWANDCEHVAFGHISFGDEGMSTRKGNVVFLSDVLGRAVEMAEKIVEEKNPNLDDRETVAEAVGLGAVLFADLSSKRIKDVKFSWEDMLSFDGETGPYLQYTLVRTRSVLRKYGKEVDIGAATDLLKEKEEIAVIRYLAMWPIVLERAERDREPFLLAQYVVELAKLFNRFYQAHRVIDAEEAVRPARIRLVHAISDVLTTGLKILGVPPLEKM